MPASRPAAERFWEKVNKTDDCWLWTGALNSEGYGSFHDGRTVRAHRWAYLNLTGPIPEGLHLDHLCRVRNCVRPDHLEPVTNKENHDRGISAELSRNDEMCRNGLHPWPESAYIPTTGRPQCHECRRAAGREAWARLKDVRWVCPKCGNDVQVRAKSRHIKRFCK